jgi:hypothetical protein
VRVGVGWVADDTLSKEVVDLRVDVAVLGNDSADALADRGPLNRQFGDLFIVADRMVNENDRAPVHFGLTEDARRLHLRVAGICSCRYPRTRRPPEVGCKTLLSAAPLSLHWDERRRMLGFST